MTATNKNWLEELKPGDLVIVARKLHDSTFEKVSRVTPKQIVIEWQGLGGIVTRRFAKKDCYEIGSGKERFIPYLAEATEASLKAIKDKKRIYLLRDWFPRFAFSDELECMEKMISALSPEDRARLKVPQGE